MAAVTLTKENFKDEVYQDGVAILVEFWSPDHEICRMIRPIIDQLLNETEIQVKLGRVNIDEEDALSFLFDIQELPTFILFKDCGIVKRLEGAAPRHDILQMLEMAK